MNNKPAGQGIVPPPLVTVARTTQATPHFVNLAATTTNPGPQILSPVTIAGKAIAGQPPIQQLTGSINLTITNGAVNLRGAAGTGHIIRQERTLREGQTILRANIGPGPLQRFPLSVQAIQNPMTGGKMNPIKLHPVNMNPVNLRLAMPPVCLAGGMKGGPNMVTLRPINSPVMQLPNQQILNNPQGVQRIPIFPIQPGGKIPIAHLQPLTLRPGGSTAQSTIHLTAMPAQASPISSTIVSSPQIGPISLVSPQTLLAKQATVSTVGSNIPTSPGSSGPINLSLSGKAIKATDQPTNLVIRKQPIDQPVKLTKKAESLVVIQPVKVNDEPNKQSKTDNTEKSSSQAKTSVDDISASEKSYISSGGSDSENGFESNDEIDDKSDSEFEGPDGGEDERTLQNQGKDITSHEPMTQDGSTVVKEEEEEDIPDDDGLVWKDGIGILPGSDLKFHKNEFGVLEMLSEALDIESIDTPVKDNKAEYNNTAQNNDTKPSAADGEDDRICCCESCGIHGLAQDFCSGGRFCSRRCVGTFASKYGALARKQNIASEMAAKRKKRKISDDSEEGVLLKVPKVEEDAMSTCSTESTPKKFDDPVSMKSKTTVPPGGKRARSFSWNVYLEQENAIAAPNKLFREFQDIPSIKNLFKVGMRLEAIDPRHPSLYCVVTVAEVRGFRLRLHFDGYDGYDFWTNADSPFIFHAGWSEKNGKTLMPPKAYVGKKFDWSDNLKLQRAIAAPKSFFSTLSTTSLTPHGFRQGMKLEAVDKKNSNLICVATVTDVLGDNILIHFDGWEHIYDYWCDPTSPYIHPIGWCLENGVSLSPPQDWKDLDSFTWDEYLEMEKTSPVPARAFKPRSPNNFESGMRLEVVDKRNPVLVRAATVVETEAYSMTIHFDGWSDMYDYSIDDDSPDIHPCGWCAKTIHPLTPPLTPKDLLVNKSEGCPTPGCTGIGHIKGSRYIGHHSAFGCPYTVTNMNKENPLSDRMFLASLDYQYKKQRKESSSPVEFKENLQKLPSPEQIKATSKPDLETELANHLLEAHRHGKPLYGRGSGRGRKKTIVKLMQEVEQLRAKTNSQQLQHLQQSFQPLHTTPPIISPTQMPLFPLTNGILGVSATPGIDGSNIHQSVFTPAQLTPHPYQDLPLGFEQNHSSVLPDVGRYRAETVSLWDPPQVAEFVSKLPGCQNIAHILEEEQVDGEALLLLNQADMVRVLNIKLGPALKLHNTILTLKNNIEV